MAKIPFLSDIDLTLNQLLQAKLENLAADPATPTESRLYYNTATKKIKYHNGTTWEDVVSGSDTRLTNARTPTAHVLATNVGLGAEQTMSGAAVGWVLRASGATTANFQQLAHADLANAGTNTHSQIDSHLGDATKHRVINDAGSSATELFSASKILQLIADINTTITGGLINKGGYNAATNVPALAATPIAGIKTGWTYVITTAGTFFTEAVQVGDMISAKQDSPTALAHWLLVNKNIPDIVQATTAAQGIVQLATNAEAITGTDTAKVVTPAALHAKVASETVIGLVELATPAEVAAGVDAVRAVTPAGLKSALGITTNLSVARKFASAAIGDGSTTSFVVNHALNTKFVTVFVIEEATPFNVVETEVRVTDANNVTVVFNTAPSTGQYRVVVIG